MIRHRQTKSNNELQSEFRRHLRFWLAGELDLTEQMRTPPATEEQPPARYRPQRSEVFYGGKGAASFQLQRQYVYKHFQSAG